MPCEEFQLYIRCVDSYSPEHVDRLNAMTDAGREVSFDTFFRHVDLRKVSESLGYEYGAAQRGLHMRRDRCVRFFRSKWQGRRCYYMVWSAIEHVFLLRKDIDDLTC